MKRALFVSAAVLANVCTGISLNVFDYFTESPKSQQDANFDDDDAPIGGNQFSVSVLIDMIHHTVADPNNIPIEPLCDQFNQFAIVMSSLGKLGGMAFQDMAEKCATIKSNRDILLKETGYDYSLSLNNMIDAEIALGISRQSPRPTKPLWQQKYLLSSARSLVRLEWGYRFILLIFENLVNDQNMPLDVACNDAYSRSLALHHPWYL